MSGANEYDFEPVRGLPETLPPGETILWQGSPGWKTIAVRAMHVRGTAIYFAVVLAWYIESKLSQGEAAGDVALSALRLTVFASVAVGLLALYAWLSGRTTIYTMTDKRVVIRSGVALPKMHNLPYSQLESANLRLYDDGSGDIALALPSSDRVAYLMLWPHVRPWRFNRAEPMLRGVAKAGQVAQILARAIAAQGGMAQGVAAAPGLELSPAIAQQRPRAAALA